MRRLITWLTVLALCCAAGPEGGETKPDARLQEAQTAYDEARKLDEAGKYANAVEQGGHALALREAVLGGSHPEVAHCLDLLGKLHRLQGDLDRAEPLIQRGLSIREEALGKNHPDVAQSLNNLANVYVERGSYGQAESLHQRALAIRETTLGEHHPLVATSLNNLAILYDQQGMYSRAEPLYQRALAIREEAFGENHFLVATSLSNLAILYSEQGLYSRAEPLYQRALAIRQTTLGAAHPDVAGALSNLANIYREQGMYGQAEPLYRRALDIKETALGKNNLGVAISLHNLAVIYLEQGMYSRAEPLYQRALAIREEALGKSHPLIAQSLEGLAYLYSRQGLYARAEPFHLRALAMLEKAVGKNHPDVAQSLNGLADLYSRQGRHARAESFYLRALAIREEALGKNHPRVAESLNGLALLRLAQHRLDAAIPLFTRAFSVSEQRLRQEALDFSESRLASFLQFLRTDEERLYALLRAHPANANVRRLALGAALLLKGRSVEETAGISRAVYRSMGAQEHDTFERLRGLRTQLAHLSLQGPGPLPLTAWQQQVQELTERGDALEADLARRSAPLRALAALPSSADIVDRVAQALPQDGALVELITYEDRPLLPRPGTPKAQLRCLALVLFPDATTRALDLGPAEPITSAASNLRTALANRDAAFQTHAQALYTLVFHPLRPLLGKAHRLFVSPDGQLTLVPFAALHDGRHFLVDTFDFTYLTSGKDLLPRPEKSVPATSVVVLADPDFSSALPPSAPSSEEASAAAERSASVERFFSSLREDPTHRAWSTLPLPGTRQEAEAIQALLPQAQLFLGPEANKERLLHLPTPSILHLATHGFFLDDTPAAPHSRGVGHFGAMGDAPRASRPPDPLLRSGLLLTGARSQPPSNSGLVTALELAGLDLWGTQLVVLSACDTGRGDVKLGQGVYGLRRAFIVAGAETVVMSLWQVKDDTTSQLMAAYYRNLLAGRGRAMALREAMLSLRATRPHPHDWAPFIALGRDTPLRELGPTPPEPPKQ